MAAIKMKLLRLVIRTAPGIPDKPRIVREGASSILGTPFAKKFSSKQNYAKDMLI